MKKEIRVFVVDPSGKNYPKDFDRNCSDEEFISIARGQAKREYPLKEFENTINGLINFVWSNVWVRFIEVEIPEFTPEQEKQIGFLYDFIDFVEGSEEKPLDISFGEYRRMAKEFIKSLGDS